MVSPSQSPVAAFHSVIIAASYEKPADRIGVKRDVSVLRFIFVHGAANSVGAARCEGLQTRLLAFCRARCKTTPSPTKTVVTSLAFACPYWWRKWSPTQNHKHSKNWKGCCTRLHTCTALPCTLWTVKQWCTLRPKCLHCHYPASSSASDKLEVVKKNGDDVGATVDIHGFSTIAYSQIDMWDRID